MWTLTYADSSGLGPSECWGGGRTRLLNAIIRINMLCGAEFWLGGVSTQLSGLKGQKRPCREHKSRRCVLSIISASQPSHTPPWLCWAQAGTTLVSWDADPLFVECLQPCFPRMLCWLGSCQDPLGSATFYKERLGKKKKKKKTRGERRWVFPAPFRRFPGNADSRWSPDQQKTVEHRHNYPAQPPGGRKEKHDVKSPL